MFNGRVLFIHSAISLKWTDRHSFHRIDVYIGSLLVECGKAQLLWKGNRSNATVEHDSRFDYRAHPISITTSYGLGRFERLQVFRVQCGAGTNTRLMLYKHISSSLPVTQMNT